MKESHDATHADLYRFIAQSADLGSAVELMDIQLISTYTTISVTGIIYTPNQKMRMCLAARSQKIMSLLKRWLIQAHQQAISRNHLDDFHDGFTYQFNRRTSARATRCSTAWHMALRRPIRPPNAWLIHFAERKLGLMGSSVRGAALCAKRQRMVLSASFINICPRDAYRTTPH